MPALLKAITDSIGSHSGGIQLAARRTPRDKLDEMSSSKKRLIASSVDSEIGTRERVAGGSFSFA